MLVLDSFIPNNNMPVQNLARLPVLLALTLQLSLGPTSSFSISSPRSRLWTPLGSAHGSDDGGDAGSDVTGRPERRAEGANLFERVARKVTQNENYRFGDITRSVVNTTTSGVEDVVRSVTQDEDYRFGDYTKKIVGSTTGGIEGAVKAVTGKEGGLIRRLVCPDGPMYVCLQNSSFTFA